jgi:hypothetical protein
VALVSNIEPNGKKRVAQCEWVIQQRPTTRMVWPELQILPGPHSKFSFNVIGGGGTVDPNFSAWGAFSAGTGSRVDLLLLDDVVDQNNAILNPARRPMLIEHLDAVWYSRMEPSCGVCQGTGTDGGLEAYMAGSLDPCITCYGTGGGRSLGIGTLWQTEDFWHNRMATPGFCMLLQRVLPSKCGYSTEVFGVPAGLKYPSLEELILLGSPAFPKDELLDMLGNDMRRKHELEARRAA